MCIEVNSKMYLQSRRQASLLFTSPKRDVMEAFRMSGFAGIILSISKPAEEQEKFNASCKTMNENYQLSLT